MLRAGTLQLQEVPLDEQDPLVQLVQQAGTLLADFDAEAEIARRLTIETEFSAVTVNGTRFLLVHESNTPLEWVIGLEAAANDLMVETSAAPHEVTGGMARWVAPDGTISEGIAYDQPAVQRWLDNVQQGQGQPAIGEVLWAHADLVADTSPLASLPEPGTAFMLDGIEVTLDPVGLGDARYALEDCNADGIDDIRLWNGRLQLNYRPLLRRVTSVDLALLNREAAESARVRTLNPARETLEEQTVPGWDSGPQLVSFRSEEEPYHFAEVEMVNGCFLGFSLTPPAPDGSPAPPREVVEQGTSLNPTPTDGASLVTRSPSVIDLVSERFFAPQSALAGESLYQGIGAVVANRGKEDTGAFVVDFMLSRDDTIDASDLRVGSVTLRGLAAGSTTEAIPEVVQIPRNVPKGVYFLGALLDSSNRVAEWDESNNVAYSPIQIDSP